MAHRAQPILSASEAPVLRQARSLLRDAGAHGITWATMGKYGRQRYWKRMLRRALEKSFAISALQAKKTFRIDHIC
jgi:hypothetical protein